MKQRKATVCSEYPWELFVPSKFAKQWRKAMTFIKFDIGEYFPQFSTAVTVFGSKADDERHCAHGKNKILSKYVSSLHAPRNGHFSLDNKLFFILFHVAKMPKNFGTTKFYLSRDLSWITRYNGLTGNENWRKLLVAIFHDFSGASDRVLNEIESVPWWPRPRKCLRVTLAI